MVNTLDFGGVRTAVFREARTDCIRDFCQKGHKQGCERSQYVGQKLIYLW